VFQGYMLSMIGSHRVSWLQNRPACCAFFTLEFLRNCLRRCAAKWPIIKATDTRSQYCDSTSFYRYTLSLWQIYSWNTCIRSTIIAARGFTSVVCSGIYLLAFAPATGPIMSVTSTPTGTSGASISPTPLRSEGGIQPQAGSPVSGVIWPPSPVTDPSVFT